MLETTNVWRQQSSDPFNEDHSASPLKMNGIKIPLKIILLGFCLSKMACGDERSTINNPMKVSLQGAKVDATNPHDLCFELGKGRSTVTMENSGSGIPRESIQPLDHTDNYLS